MKETRGFIDRNLLPAIGSLPLSKLKPSDLDRFYRRLLAGGRGGQGRVGAGDRAPHPRHPSLRTCAGRQVGLVGGQPRGGHNAATRAAVEDQSAVRPGSHSRPTTSPGLVAGAGVLPGPRRGDRSETIGIGRAALARRRPVRCDGPDRAWRGDGP
ncbi:MAG: hypothetical protein ACRDZ2_16770 [Ilumatobacteraceae bacterium]